jgi:hypothetical protein
MVGLLSCAEVMVHLLAWWEDMAVYYCCFAKRPTHMSAGDVRAGTLLSCNVTKAAMQPADLLHTKTECSNCTKGNTIVHMYTCALYPHANHQQQR